MAKKGDMLYAWTNDADIKKKAELGGAVTALWKHALESKVVDAVLAIKKGADIYDAQPVLITDPKELAQTAGSLHCGTLLMPKLVKKYMFSSFQKVEIFPQDDYAHVLARMLFGFSKKPLFMKLQNMVSALLHACLKVSGKKLNAANNTSGFFIHAIK